MIEKMGNQLQKRGLNTGLITLLNNGTPIEVQAFESSLTLKDASKGTLIVELDNVNKVDLIIGISKVITRTLKTFNISNNMDEFQVAQLASDLLDKETFGCETLEDILMMFKMLRTGKLGVKVYNRLDGQFIMGECVPAYLDLKAQMREQEHRKEKEQFKKEMQDGTNIRLKELALKVEKYTKPERQKATMKGKAKVEAYLHDLNLSEDEKLRREYSRAWSFKKHGRYQDYMEQYDSNNKKQV